MAQRQTLLKRWIQGKCEEELDDRLDSSSLNSVPKRSCLMDQESDAGSTAGLDQRYARFSES